MDGVTRRAASLGFIRGCYLIPSGGLPILGVGESGGSSKFALRLILPAQARKRQAQIVVAGAIVRRSGNSAIEIVESPCVLLLVETGFTGSGQGSAMERIAGEGPVEVGKSFLGAILFEGHVAELIPGFGLFGLEFDGLLKRLAGLVKLKAELVNPAEPVIRGCVVGTQFQIGQHPFFGRIQLLAVKENAGLCVEKRRVIEVEPPRLLQRAGGFRIEVHFILENAEIVGEARVLRRVLSGAHQGLEGIGHFALRPLVERNALAGGHFTLLRCIAAGISSEDRFEDVAGLGRIAGLEQGGSRLDCRLLGLHPARSGRHEHSENGEGALHRIGAHSTNFPNEKAGGRVGGAAPIIGARMRWVWAAASVAMALGGVAVCAQAANAYQQAEAAFAAHRYTESAPLFAQAEAENPGKTDALLMEGKSLVNVGQFAQAEAALRTYASVHPDSSDALYMLGYVLNREDKPAESLNTYTQAAKLTTPQSDDLKVVALDYVLLNDYDDAIRWMKQAVAFDPNNEQAWYGLGRCLYSQSEFREAEAAFQRALALDPRDVKAEANLGLAYEMANQPQEAEQAYKAAVVLANADAKTDEWPYLDYASFLLEHDRPGEAIPLLEKAVTVAPRCAQCHGKLGRALAETGKAKQGVEQLRTAVTLSPQDPKLHYDLGRAYRAAGEMEQARAELALSAKLYGSKDSPGRKQ